MEKIKNYVVFTAKESDEKGIFDVGGDGRGLNMQSFLFDKRHTSAQKFVRDNEGEGVQTVVVKVATERVYKILQAKSSLKIGLGELLLTIYIFRENTDGPNRSTKIYL